GAIGRSRVGRGVVGIAARTGAASRRLGARQVACPAVDSDWERAETRQRMSAMRNERSKHATAEALPAENSAIRDLARRMRGLRDRVVAEVGRVVVGMEEVTHQFLIALVGGGHVLLEGVPGVAKTTLSKTFARVLGVQYQRIQFTPDLLP